MFIPDDGNGKYKVVKLQEKKIDEVIEKLKASRISEEKYLWSRHYHVPIDGGALYVEVYFDSKYHYLATRLPYIEKQAGIVVTDKGKHVLEKNETKEKYINDHASDDYKKFREVWNQCFNLLDELYFEITGKKIIQ